MVWHRRDFCWRCAGTFIGDSSKEYTRLLVLKFFKTFKAAVEYGPDFRPTLTGPRVTAQFACQEDALGLPETQSPPELRSE